MAPNVRKLSGGDMHMPIRETSQCINWRAEAKFCLSRSTNLRLSPDVASARGFVKPRSVAPLSKKKGWCLVTAIKQYGHASISS